MSLTPEEYAEFERLVANEMPDRIITRWIVVCETHGPEGPDLEIAMSNNVNPWLVRGMLDYAADVVAYNVYSEDDGGERE